MCIAIASEKGVKVPCKKYLQNCFEYNDDGAGFAFAYNGKVAIIKGLMTFNDFWKTFSKYNSKYNFTKCGVLIHFRIGTHGGINKECTHPFPLTDDVKELHKTELVTNFAVVHNGIISLTSADARKEEKMSDTMVFIRDYLTDIASYKGWFMNPTTTKFIYKLADSKFAILNANGDIIHTEGFTKDADGNWYSNDSYKDDYYTYKYSAAPVATPSIPTGWGSSDSYYGDGWYDSYYDNYYDNCAFNKDATPKESYYIPLMRVDHSVPYNVVMFESAETDEAYHDGKPKMFFVDELSMLYTAYTFSSEAHKDKDGHFTKPIITTPLLYIGKVQLDKSVVFTTDYLIDDNLLLDAEDYSIN